MAEIKSESSPTTDAVKGIALTGGGALVANRFLPHLFGKQKLYHGTTKDVAAKILREGFDPKHGGGVQKTIMANMPASMVERLEEITGRKGAFTESSKGFMHFGTSYGAAAAHGDIAAAKKLKFKRYLMMLLPPVGRLMGKGRVLPVYPEYTKDLASALAGEKQTATLKSLAGTPRLRGERWISDMDMGGGILRAVKTPQKVGPEAIGLRGLFRNLKSLPKYIRSNPGRFGLGIAGVGAGAALAGYGASKLLNKE